MKKKYASARGFSLIELLIVIAIIGILAGVVLASLNQARAKGADAAIKLDLSHMRAQSENYYSDNGSFGAKAQTSDCTIGFFSDSRVTAAVADAVSKNGGNAATCMSDNQEVTNPNAESWAISVPLKTDSATSWCVDDQGTSQLGIAEIIANVASCV